MGQVRGRERVKETLARLPKALKAAVAEQLDKENEQLVEAIKRACPIGVDIEHHPGALRDSVHGFDAGDRELKKRILVDATDGKGAFIAPHVEFGHQTPGGGGHVPAVPFFFPTIRATKTARKRRLSAAGRKAVRQVAAEAVKD